MERLRVDADIKRETERWMEICAIEIPSEIGSRRAQREIDRERDLERLGGG